jgi:hypothetical protein
MDIKPIEEDLIAKLNKNFSDFEKYFNPKIEIFFELKTLIYEINYCIILEFYRASITLTNHLLERLLKLALIYNEIGIGPIPTDQWNSIFEKPHKKFSSIDLSNSIELCKKFGLISDHEKQFLFGTIRELMRNGFSHADSSKILASLPDNSRAFTASLHDPTNLKEVSLNQKIIPFLQELQMENFAKETAKDYFDFVFNLLFMIEKKIIKSQK